MMMMFRSLMAALSVTVVVSAASIVSTADSRLPMSLSTVVSDLEAEGCTELSTACWITSRSVSREKRVAILEQILDSGDISHNEQAGTADTWKAVATTAGFALAQPSSYQETASAACACGGTILYYADPTDLQRGEGLFDMLAPAMEKILTSTLTSTTPTLYVLVDEGNDEAAVRSRLEQIAETVLQNLISEHKDVATLEDVFHRVVYVSPTAAVKAVTDAADEKTTPADVAALVAEMWSTEAWSSTGTTADATELTPSNLAAARSLGPAVRLQLEKTVAFVKQACAAEENGSESESGQSMRLVPNFGELWDAAIKQAADMEGDKSNSSVLGMQLRANLQADLDAAMSDIFADQVSLLQKASFEEFKRGLSKLLVSPNLQTDMEAVASKSVAAFATAAKKLGPKSAKTTWTTVPAKLEYTRQLKDYVAGRILAAKASGKFKPLPRKGFTVGMHWLLPKPFGNDVRQEPWMVHASDNLVYIPDSKVSDVNPEEVASGDWRNKIVPSPAGNDMLYMQ